MPRSVANNNGPIRTILLAADQQNSIVAEHVGGQLNRVAYSAYGHQSASQPIHTRLGFNGELSERILGGYLLGNGYRAYNPTLMRFHSPDSLSPFGKGGLNAYMYCVGDPVNFTDPTGHMFKAIGKKFFKTKPVNSASSSSPLVPRSRSPSPQRAGANQSTSATTTSPYASNSGLRRELDVRPGAEHRGAPVDPTTGESIYGPLPLGRRTWDPRTEQNLSSETMSYREMASTHNSSLPSNGASGNGARRPGVFFRDDEGRERVVLGRGRNPAPARQPGVFFRDENGRERVVLGSPRAEATGVRKNSSRSNS